MMKWGLLISIAVFIFVYIGRDDPNINECFKYQNIYIPNLDVVGTLNSLHVKKGDIINNSLTVKLLFEGDKKLYLSLYKKNSMLGKGYDLEAKREFKNLLQKDIEPAIYAKGYFRFYNKYYKGERLPWWYLVTSSQPLHNQPWVVASCSAATEEPHCEIWGTWENIFYSTSIDKELLIKIREVKMFVASYFSSKKSECSL